MEAQRACVRCRRASMIVFAGASQTNGTQTRINYISITCIIQLSYYIRDKICDTQFRKRALFYADFHPVDYVDNIIEDFRMFKIY